jgi:hypothetical protein
MNNSSHINNGIFNTKIILQDNSYINHGYFNKNIWNTASVELFDNSYINNGRLNNDVLLCENSKIIDAVFGDDCKVYLMAEDKNNKWVKDQATLDILKGRVQYE